jgi:hypothetical protein
MPLKLQTIRPVYVESFPDQLEPGVLYISRRFRTACHSCFCGCGTKIVTPIRPTEYTLTDVNDRVSMTPSIGNWSHPCRSHYVIRDNQVLWAEQMSDAAIAIGRTRDAAEKRAYFRKPWWTRLLEWLGSLFP